MEDSSGDLWTFTSICRDTKLVSTWRVGMRTAYMAKEFIADLLPRMANKIELTSDAFTQYKDAVEDLMIEIDYGQLKKLYDGRGRYMGSRKKVLIGISAHQQSH